MRGHDDTKRVSQFWKRRECILYSFTSRIHRGTDGVSVHLNSYVDVDRPGFNELSEPPIVGLAGGTSQHQLHAIVVGPLVHVTVHKQRGVQDGRRKALVAVFERMVGGMERAIAARRS